MTPEQIAELVATGGRFWWLRGDQIVTTETLEPADPGDMYGLDASEAWVAQWDNDWQAASDQLTPLFARRQETGDT